MLRRDRARPQQKYQAVRRSRSRVLHSRTRKRQRSSVTLYTTHDVIKTQKEATDDLCDQRALHSHQGHLVRGGLPGGLVLGGDRQRTIQGMMRLKRQVNINVVVVPAPTGPR